MNRKRMRQCVFADGCCQKADCLHLTRTFFPLTTCATTRKSLFAVHCVGIHWRAKDKIAFLKHRKSLQTFHLLTVFVSVFLAATSMRIAWAERRRQWVQANAMLESEYAALDCCRNVSNARRARFAGQSALVRAENGVGVTSQILRSLFNITHFNPAILNSCIASPQCAVDTT